MGRRRERVKERSFTCCFTTPKAYSNQGQSSYRQESDSLSVFKLSLIILRRHFVSPLYMLCFKTYLFICIYLNGEQRAREIEWLYSAGLARMSQESGIECRAPIEMVITLELELSAVSNQMYINMKMDKKQSGLDLNHILQFEMCK